MTDADAETPILWPPHAKSWLIGKDPDAGKDWRREEKGTTEDEMAGWHHWLDGCESEWTLGVGDGQGGLACCSPRGHRAGHDLGAKQDKFFQKWISVIGGRYALIPIFPSSFTYSASLNVWTFQTFPQDTLQDLCSCPSQNKVTFKHFLGDLVECFYFICLFFGDSASLQ